ncbi:sugar transporter [Rickenella mellea]|uniref:Sugar transporter n=1 Tax=Rickenella mellea TaxID=50990 RepID=A0A4V3AZK4_9AGAM|nr:sugar transporter [Rickenella mellea]
MTSRPFPHHAETDEDHQHLLVGAEPANNDELNSEFGGTSQRKLMERNLLRKLDSRMSILIIIYILNYIDRNNAAAARLRGFEEDLRLKGKEFDSILSILYVGYIIMQVPSNMLLNYIGKPSVYLPVCMIIWGSISILTGFATNFFQAFIARFFLGFVEAAFFPGALFLLSKWYKRDELGLRTALLFCGSLMSNAFGALLASGILNAMEGTFGRAAWRWLFYVEGSLTVFFAIIALFILPDFPSNSMWLSPLERRLAERRLQEDIGVDDKATHGEEGWISGLTMTFSDWTVWWLALALGMMVVSLSFNTFFPTLSETMGFNTTITLLLCAPPWLFATVMAFVVARHSDKSGERFFHIVGPLVLGILGFLVAISTMNTAARYVSLFLMAQSYAGFVTFYAWISNSIPHPPLKRAIALAFINAFSQLGNVVAAFAWPRTWGPSYAISYEICIATSVCAIAMCYLFKRHLIRVNEQLEREEEERGEVRTGFRFLL